MLQPGPKPLAGLTGLFVDIDLCLLLSKGVLFWIKTSSEVLMHVGRTAKDTSEENSRTNEKLKTKGNIYQKRD